MALDVLVLLAPRFVPARRRRLLLLLPLPRDVLDDDDGDDGILVLFSAFESVALASN